LSDRFRRKKVVDFSARESNEVRFMHREWLAYIEGFEQGPYTARELSTHPQVTPDTFVRKKQGDKWVRIRHVFELREIFKDKPIPQALNQDKKVTQTLPVPDDATLTLSQPDPFLPYVWSIALIFFLIYLFYLIYE